MSISGNKKFRIALVVSHPIQHFCPQYVSFAQHPQVEFKAFFGSTLGLKKYVDPKFNREVSWGNLGLNEFDHEFLNGDAVVPINGDLDAVNLEEKLSAFQPDLLIVYGYFQRIQKRAYNWAKNNNVRLAYISDAENRRKRARWKHWLKKIYLNRYFSKIDYFLTVGDANESYYQQYGVDRKKFIRMHFPINVKEFEAAYNRRVELGAAVRAKYNIKEDEFVMSVVGKVIKDKNQDDIIRALQLIDGSERKITVLIVGSGDKENEWSELAKGIATHRIVFAGFISPQELPAYYAASDLYIHPSSADAHSLAISEAIFMGLPCLISDRCGSFGPTDDVQPGVNGWVYPFSQLTELSAAIKKAGNSPLLLAEFGEKSRAIALDAQYKAHKGVLDDLLKTTKAY